MNSSKSKILKSLQKNYKHVICIALITVFLIIAIICFPASFIRFGESVRDLGISIANFFVMLFTGNSIECSVNKFSIVSAQDLGLLPKNKELFFVKFKLYLRALFTVNNINNYLLNLGDFLYYLSYAILIIASIVAVVVLIAWLSMRKENMEVNDTKPLQIFKKITLHTYVPIKNWIKIFIEFIKEHKIYPIICLIEWLFVFNVVSIAVEFFAYYFYIVITFDFTTFYIQILKLLFDLAVPITTIPPLIQAIVILIIYDVWRNYHARKKRDKIEATDEEIAQELPIASLITGAMNTKKTTSVTDFAITFNKIFRDVALKKLIANDMKFPYFPWIRLERCIKYGMDKHTIFNLASARHFVRQVKAVYYKGNDYPNLKDTFLHALKLKYGYEYKDLLFEYDYERYGFTYYDELELQTIFDVLEIYAQLYFIYVIESSFIISSYSIRIDDYKKDNGNFPLWDIDFFRNDTEEIQKYTRRSHIIDFDALRLGKRIVENNKFANSLDFGIIVVTEIGKERGNKNTLQGVKQSSATANQKNDLFNIDVKMCRHRATVDNYPFVVFLMDEQRAASLNADTSELCDILYIADSSEFKFITPLFALDELIWTGVTKLFNLYYPKDRHNKANDNVFRHAVKCLYNLINRHYIKIYHRYSASTLTFSAHKGSESETHTKKYKLLKKKIHAGRFSTDAFAAYYYVKTMRSNYGINDMPEFSGKTATFEELDAENSFFVNLIKEAFIYDKHNNDDDTLSA